MEMTHLHPVNKSCIRLFLESNIVTTKCILKLSQCCSCISIAPMMQKLVISPTPPSSHYSPARPPILVPNLHPTINSRAGRESKNATRRKGPLGAVVSRHILAERRIKLYLKSACNGYKARTTNKRLGIVCHSKSSPISSNPPFKAEQSER